MSCALLLPATSLSYSSSPLVVPQTFMSIDGGDAVHQLRLVNVTNEVFDPTRKTLSRLSLLRASHFSIVQATRMRAPGSCTGYQIEGGDDDRYCTHHSFLCHPLREIRRRVLNVRHHRRTHRKLTASPSATRHAENPTDPFEFVPSRQLGISSGPSKKRLLPSIPAAKLDTADHFNTKGGAEGVAPDVEQLPLPIEDRVDEQIDESSPPVPSDTAGAPLVLPVFRISRPRPRRPADSRARGPQFGVASTEQHYSALSGCSR